MKNVKTASFRQIDHQIEITPQGEAMVILPSPEAYETLPWTRPYFGQRPDEGYFIWVKKQLPAPLITCISIASRGVEQNLGNLLVIEKNLHVEANATCEAARSNLYGIHRAKGKFILKEGAELIYQQIHRWGEKDFVNPDYDITLERGARLDYVYKNIQPPEKLEIKTTLHLAEKASGRVSTILNATAHTQANIKEVVFLEGQESRGTAQLKIVGRQQSQVTAVNKIVAQAAGQGHLDCQGLLVGKKATIDLVPQLVCQHPQAQLTHEASIGKIADEQLNYLRSRGLTEKQAIDLITSGFLGE